MWDTLPSEERITMTIEALKSNNMAAEVLDADQVKERVMSMVPKGASVLTSTSATLDSMGISNEINESGKYVPFREQIFRIADKEARLVERR